MSRPKCCYKISFCPKAKKFSPEDTCRTTGVVEIAPEEAEALRLKHIQGLEQTEAAKKMKVSQSTFQRVLAAAHRKVSEALIGGKIILVVGSARIKKPIKK